MLRSNSDCFGLGTELWLTKCHTGKTLLVCGRVDVHATRKALHALPPDDQAMYRPQPVRRFCNERKVTKQSGRIRQMRASGVVSLTPFTTVTGLVLSIRISEKPMPLWPPKSWIPFPQLLPSVGGRCFPTYMACLDQYPWQLCLPNCLVPAIGLRPDCWNDVFTDGSCLFQSTPMYRLAAWSVVCAQPFSGSWTPGGSTVLGASFLLAFAKLHTVLSCLLWLTPFTVLPVRVPLSGFGRTVWVLLPGFINCFGEGLGCPVNRSNSDLWCWISTSLDTLGRDEYSSARCRRTEFSAVLAPNLRRGNSFTMQWQTKRQGCPIRLVLLIFGGNGSSCTGYSSGHSVVRAGQEPSHRNWEAQRPRGPRT